MKTSICAPLWKWSPLPCPRLCPAICHCCTMGSVRMGFGPLWSTCHPFNPEAHSQLSYTSPRPGLNYGAITPPALAPFHRGSLSLSAFGTLPSSRHRSCLKLFKLQYLKQHYIFSHKQTCEITLSFWPNLANEVITPSQQTGCPLQRDREGSLARHFAPPNIWVSRLALRSCCGRWQGYWDIGELNFTELRCSSCLFTWLGTVEPPVALRSVLLNRTTFPALHFLFFHGEGPAHHSLLFFHLLLPSVSLKVSGLPAAVFYSPLPHFYPILFLSYPYEKESIVIYHY